MDAVVAENIHKSVMLSEVLELLPRSARHLDGTLGLGGHASAMLERDSSCRLCGLDQDGEALALARERLKPYGARVHCFQRQFADFEAVLADLGWETVDTALLDLGVSSLQLDQAGRGFSFRLDGGLDMRMNPASGHKSAWHMVNRATFGELRDCFAILGEDPQAGRIARHIVEARQKGGIDTTLQLAEIVRMAYPPAWRRNARRHPATRCFQALRMAVNDELGQLRCFLEHIWPCLATGGRLAIISFHSLEDRLVKHAMRQWAKSGEARLVTRKPLSPTEAEIAANPRAASAKLRVAERV